MQTGPHGVRRSGVEVSNKHAGLIVNIGHTTTTDYVEMIEYVRREVHEKFVVRLEVMVQIIGEN